MSTKKPILRIIVWFVSDDGKLHQVTKASKDEMLDHFKVLEKTQNVSYVRVRVAYNPAWELWNEEAIDSLNDLRGALTVGDLLDPYLIKAFGAKAKGMPNQAPLHA